MAAMQQMREAAQRRATAVRDGNTADGQSMPNGSPAPLVSTGWLSRSAGAPMPPRLRAKKVEREGKQFHVVEGYATVYERGYEMWDFFGPYTEVVSAGAADKTLATNPDVVFLTNHRGLAMARTIAATLELWSDTTGMGDRAWLNPARQDVKDLVLGIDDATITEQSFAFMITLGRWSPDYTEYRIDEFDIDRGDVSAVNYGANPHTSIAARSREILDELRQLPAGAAREALEVLNHRTDLTSPYPTTTPTREAVGDATGRSLSELEGWLAAAAR